jgi:hypothetical protein
MGARNSSRPPQRLKRASAANTMDAMESCFNGCGYSGFGELSESASSGAEGREIDFLPDMHKT